MTKHRFHFMDVNEGESLARYFAKRQCHARTSTTGCNFPRGLVVEIDSRAFDAALDLADAFNMIYDVEY